MVLVVVLSRIIIFVFLQTRILFPSNLIINSYSQWNNLYYHYCYYYSLYIVNYIRSFACTTKQKKGIRKIQIVPQPIYCQYSFVSLYNICSTLHYIIVLEPAHGKTYNKTCAATEDQPAHSRRLLRVFADHMHLFQPPGYPKRGLTKIFVILGGCTGWS